MAAQIPYRANLTTGFLPFLVSVQGQTVIVAGRDNNITPQDSILPGEGAANRDKGFPSVSYMHNVFPTNTGFKSIGFARQVDGISNDNFQNCFILRDVDENVFLYAPVSGKHYVWNAQTMTWTASSSAIISSSTLVTIAYINGHTYIFFEKIGMFEYNKTTGNLDAVVLTGVTATLLTGICAAKGYLMAWDDFTVYRSQPLSILNFTPDPSLGSGSSIPQDIKGKIVACLPITDGFIIYCTKNAVAASFQNNIQYPFQYKEVAGSGGILDPTMVTWTANLGTHYAWTSNGFQQINKVQAQQLFPEVTDFLTAQVYETFNTTTRKLEVTKVSFPLAVKMALVQDRYLCISYGIDNLTDALVLDLAYKRWGKLKFDHVAIFEYRQPNLFSSVRWQDLGNITWEQLGNTAWQDFSTGFVTYDNPNQVIALLKKNGEIHIVELDNVSEDETGLILLGKYQFVRDRWLTLESVSVQNSTPYSDQIKIYDLPTYDGMTFKDAVEGVEDPDDEPLGTIVNFFFPGTEGWNHTVAIEGTFSLSDLQLMFTPSSHT